MSMNYGKAVPLDRNGTQLHDFAVVAPSALGTRHRENASTSSVTSLDGNCTSVEITAVTTGAGIRWAVDQQTSVVTDASGANFDHFIPAGQLRRFVIPRNTQATPNYNSQGSPSVTGLNTSEGLFGGIASKSVGIGSVLLTQY